MVIAGLERVTVGDVLIHDHNFSTLSEEDITRIRQQYISIVFQHFHLLPTMNALENVAIPLELLGGRDPFSEAQKALDHVGLRDRLHHYPAQLSGGEQQRVALARAFVTKPSVLLADEPTGNLDTENSTLVLKLMMDLHKSHDTTLIVITHNEQLAEACSKHYALLDGVLKHHG